MAAVVVPQHDEVLLQRGRHTVPHLQVTTQSVAQHDDRSLTLHDKVKFGHGEFSFGW